MSINIDVSGAKTLVEYLTVVQREEENRHIGQGVYSHKFAELLSKDLQEFVNCFQNVGMSTYSLSRCVSVDLMKLVRWFGEPVEYLKLMSKQVTDLSKIFIMYTAEDTGEPLWVSVDTFIGLSQFKVNSMSVLRDSTTRKPLVFDAEENQLMFDWGSMELLTVWG